MHPSFIFRPTPFLVTLLDLEALLLLKSQV
jgi:hypothetical protein